MICPAPRRPSIWLLTGVLLSIGACTSTSSEEATASEGSPSGSKPGEHKKHSEHEGEEHAEHKEKHGDKTQHERHDEQAGKHDKHGDEGHDKHGDEGSGEHGDHGGGHGDNRAIQLTEKALERYGIQTEKAERGRLEDRVSAPAKVQFVPSQKAHVSPLVAGRISELNATVGDRVERGDQLAVLRSVELGEARAAVDEAQAQFDIAETNFERVERLRDKGIVSEQKLLKAKQTRAEARARLKSARSTLETFGVGGGQGPFYGLQSELEGRVIKQRASEGETKKPGESLFVVADRSPVWVIGTVFERDINKVEPGMKATVTMQSHPSREWQGTVDWVADQVDDKTRNLEVRVELPNEDGSLKPGMFGTVHLEAQRQGEMALVPVGAVQKAHGQQMVFVPTDAPRTFRGVPVETGDESKGLVEIRSGLEPGDMYVTKGAFDLRATMTAASRSGGHHH